MSKTPGLLRGVLLAIAAMMVGSGGAVGQPAPLPQTVNLPTVTPSAATGIAATDTATIQAALNVTGVSASLLYGQTYLVDTLTASANTILDCNGSTLKADGGQVVNSILNTGAISNFTIRNCIFDETNINPSGASGPQAGEPASGIWANSPGVQQTGIKLDNDKFINIPTSTQQYHAIAFNGPWHVTMSSITVPQSGGDEIALNGDGSFYSMDKLDLEYSGDGGIAFNNGARGSVSGSYFYKDSIGIGAGPEDPYATTPFQETMTITNSTFEANGSCINMGYFGNITNNTGAPNNWSVTGNVFKDCNQVAFEYYGNPGPNWPTTSIASTTWSASQATFVLSTPLLTPNYYIIPGASFTISGMTPSGYNGTYTALAGTGNNTGNTTTTLIAALASNPGAATVEGTLVLAPPTPQKAGGTLVGNKFYRTGSTSYSGTLGSVSPDVLEINADTVENSANSMSGNLATTSFGYELINTTSVNVHGGTIKSTDGGYYIYPVYAKDDVNAQISGVQTENTSSMIYSTDGGNGKQRREDIFNNTGDDVGGVCITVANQVAYVNVYNNTCQSGATNAQGVQMSSATIFSKVDDNTFYLTASSNPVISFPTGSSYNDVEAINNHTSGKTISNGNTGANPITIFPNNSGLKATVSGCSGTLSATGNKTGKVTLGANNCTLVFSPDGGINMGIINGYTCTATDLTSPLISIPQSASGTTSCSFAVPVSAGTSDVLLVTVTGGS